MSYERVRPLTPRGTPESSGLLRASTLLNVPDFSGRIADFLLTLSGPADLGG